MRSSLIAMRSLGKKNMKITGASEKNNAIGLYSKYCDKKIIYPNPRTNTKEFLKYLEKVVKKNNYDCIIPFHTYTAFLLSKYKDFFSNYTQIPPPDFEVFYKAFDKKKLLTVAIGKNISCPKTYFSNEITEIIDNIDHYPVVVKPTKRHGIEIAICNSKSDLIKNYENMSETYGNCIVQEYIPNGGEFGVYTIFNRKSVPIALTVQKRLRCKYDYGGISTLRKTTNNDKIVDIAFDLLKHIKWSGAAMVEFRIDLKDNTPKLMEINPRFWGSLQLSILAGIDFPHILYQLTMQENPLPNLNFREDVLCRWFILDAINFLKEPNKLKRLPDLLRIDIPNDIISIRDPKPGLIALLQPTLDSSDKEHRFDGIHDEIWNNPIINK